MFGPMSTVPARLGRRERRASSVRPGKRGAVSPRRSAVEPDTATPIVSVSGVLLGAGGGSRSRRPCRCRRGRRGPRARSGPVMTLEGRGLLRGRWSGDALGDLADRRVSRARSPTSRPPGAASCWARRSIACSWARTAKVVIRPPSRVRTRRSRTIPLATCECLLRGHLPGGLLQHDRPQVASRRTRRAARSAAPRRDPRAPARVWGARGPRAAARASSGPNRARGPSRATHAADRSGW